MTVPESGAGTLAQLIARRGQPARAAATWKERTPAPAANAQKNAVQFGFLFTEPLPETVESAPLPATDEGAPLDVEDADAMHLEPRRERKLWSVAELVGLLRVRLEREYTDVWVEGEISNCRPAGSGHLYFTLKDGDAQLPVVLFRRQASLLKWRPQDGLAVLVRGRVSIFESRGQLQLIAESLDPRGAGALQVQFEQLKAKLKAEGLFEAGRKRPLPLFPRTIGVVTSTQGAVIRDIVTVCRRRHGCLNILVYPSAVQGTGAASEIAAGIRYLNRAAANGRHALDVIVIARGGGSAEDLWAFNDEALARAIAASELPVVSAVGHETDFTISDFVADLRAPTPSAAAEMITAAQHRIEERLQSLETRLLRATRFQQITARQRYTALAAEGVLRRVRDGVDRRRQGLDLLRDDLERASRTSLRLRSEQLRELTGRLRRQDVFRRVTEARSRLIAAESRMEAAAGSRLKASRRGLTSAEAGLRTLSPTAVLERGYSITFDGSGRVLRSAAQATEASTILTRFADGAVRSRVVGEDKSTPEEKTGA